MKIRDSRKRSRLWRYFDFDSTTQLTVNKLGDCCQLDGRKKFDSTAPGRWRFFSLSAKWTIERRSGKLSGVYSPKPPLIFWPSRTSVLERGYLLDRLFNLINCCAFQSLTAADVSEKYATPPPQPKKVTLSESDSSALTYKERSVRCFESLYSWVLPIRSLTFWKTVQYSSDDLNGRVKKGADGGGSMRAGPVRRASSSKVAGLLGVTETKVISEMQHVGFPFPLFSFPLPPQKLSFPTGNYNFFLSYKIQRSPRHWPLKRKACWWCAWKMTCWISKAGC